MIQTTVKINGMMCGMCESHVNDAIRNHFQVKKVNSSAKKNESVILSEEELPADELKQVITDTGYEYVSSDAVPYKKKSLFHHSYIKPPLPNQTEGVLLYLYFLVSLCLFCFIMLKQRKTFFMINLPDG